jgi:hypothetical protein
VTVYFVLDHFGRLGSASRETDEEKASLENAINNILHGEYNNPMRVVAFNTAEKWSSDVSADVAWEVLRPASSQGLDLPASTRSFCECHVGLRETALASAGFKRERAASAVTYVATLHLGYGVYKGPFIGRSWGGSLTGSS